MNVINTINEFADEHFIDGNFVEQVTNLKNLNRYLYLNEINSTDIDIDVYTKILNNPKICKMVSCILSIDDYSSYLGNDFFYSLALAYSSLYGIELKTSLDNEINDEEIDREIIDYYGYNKEAGSLLLYMNEVRAYKVLNPDELKSLFIRFNDSKGEEKEYVREMIINHNLRLVISIAKRYKDRGVEFLDLIQEGNLGLMKAVDRYDYTKGFSFSTYATWWIKQMVLRAVALHSRTVRVPVYAHEIITKINNFISSYYLKNGERPTSEIIAKEFQISAKRVEELLNADEIASLDSPVKVDGVSEDSTLADFVTNPFDEEDEWISKLAFEDLVGIINHMKLSTREKIIVFERTGVLDGHAKKLETIGNDFNITRERVRQIETSALIKIRDYFKEKGIKATDYGFIEEKKPETEIKFPFTRRRNAI